MNRTVSYEDAAHHRVHDEASNIVNTEENHKDGAATVVRSFDGLVWQCKLSRRFRLLAA